MLVRDLIDILSRLPDDAVVLMTMNEEYVDDVGSAYSYFDSARGSHVVMIDDHDD